MKDYLDISDRGWVYMKDDYLGIHWRWDRKDFRVRLIDYGTMEIVNESGIGLNRLFRLHNSQISADSF